MRRIEITLVMGRHESGQLHP